MHLVDRANNCLPLLLSEPALKNGEIAFVAHSFGGLIIAELVRVADARSTGEPNVANFLQRMRRIAFLGTPHLGADLASLGGRLALISRAASVLPRNDPHLRGLNQWFRRYVDDHHIATLTLTESYRTGWFGQIVSPDSADFGLSSFPIPVDANHFTVVSPADRNSEIYRHIRDFLTQPEPPAHPQATLIEAASDQAASIAQLTQQNAEGFERLERELADTIKQASILKIPQGLVDGETRRRLLVLLRSRFFVGVNVQQDAARLASDLIDGDLQTTSALNKAEALAWCARLLLNESDNSYPKQILELARKLANCTAIEIAETFLAFYEGRSADALSRLSKLNASESKSAAFIIVAKSRSPEDALRWLDDTKADISTMDADGKFFVLNTQLQSGRWADALETAERLEEDDFQRAPVLLYSAAGAYLVQAVPDDLRTEALAQLSLEASQFPLSSSAGALAARRKAQNLYVRASQQAAALGISTAEHDASDRALWLALRDQQSRQQALAELESSMRDSAHSLRRLALALDYGLKLDLKAVENEINRQSALAGGSSMDIALARLAITFTKKDPREASDYLEKHRAGLIAFLNPAFVTSIEIQLLVKSGQLQLAQERFDALPGDTTPAVLARLQRLISEAKGSDPVSSREQLFQQSNSFADLANLLELLEERNDWPRLVTYGRICFARSHDLRGCLLLSRALYEVGDYEGVVSLLSANSEFLALSDSLLSLFSWSLYWRGDLKQASESLEKLKRKRDERDDRSLTLNLALASGDWNSLNVLIETEWDRKESRTPEELLRAGQLAQQLGSSRARQLVQEAARKGADDPAILLGSYSTAVSGGWEDNEDVHLWLAKAAASSGTDGPVQQVSLKDMLDRHPEWQRRETQIWQLYQKGDAPIFLAAHLLNRTLVDFFLFPALSNPTQIDPRKRSAIFALSGARQPVEIDARTIAIDATALLTLGVLDELDRLIELFDEVVVAHSTLAWLFEEKQRVQFHQPSRIADAKEIRRLLASGDLKEFESTATMNSELANEVGDDLAAMLADAEADFGADKRKRFVVRPGPVHRIGSLMEEEADLSSHLDHLCSCADVVEALYRKAQLTEAEVQRARDFLTVREKQWPRRVEIPSGAIFYLDQVAIAYLQHLGLLSKVGAAGFAGVIPPGERQKTDAFIQYENLSTQAAAVIETIRKSLADGISSGKVILASKASNDEIQDERMKHHPGFAIMQMAAAADAVVVDDRFMNQHRHVSAGFGQRAIYSSYDLLTSSPFTKSEQTEFVTGLRRCGFCFVPVSAVDLSRMLNASPVEDERVVENAELKALRESLLIARMSNSLQLPKEAPWLDNLMRVLLESVPLQWRDGTDVAHARVRSNWLLNLFNVRGWAQRTNPSPQVLISEVRYRAVILSLSLAQGVPQPQKVSYWRWFEEDVLHPIKEGDAELYQTLLAQIRAQITHAINNGAEDA